MKKRSIRFKMTLWFSLVLIAIVALTFLAVYWASSSVLRKTIRDYLISTVEANVDEIQFVSGQPGAAEAAGNTSPDQQSQAQDSVSAPQASQKQEGQSDTQPSDISIRYQDGFLSIDEDFMNVVNDVHTGLYTTDGRMLYGENPLAQETGVIPFTTSYTWSTQIEGVRYEFYDRKLSLQMPDGKPLWIRGIVPETESIQQLRDISRISLTLLPILIVIAVFAGYLLTSRLLAPIRQMEQAASRISEGTDLKERIDLGTGDDELHRLASVFNSMFDRLDHAFAVERQFTSDASHELRTPMSVILAQCELTLEKTRTTESYEAALRTIRRQGARMNGLINDMLDYTRMEQRAERYPLTPLNLSDLVRETAEQMSLLRTHNIKLTSNVTPDLMINGNRMLLSRLLQNLISNAYRYGKEDGIIEVSLLEEETPPQSMPLSDSAKQSRSLAQQIPRQAVLRVRDDGIGIQPEDLEKIFDRFYRSDASRSIQGTGLGLSIVRKVAELHGTAPSVESTPGEGSTFIIKFLLL